MRTLKSVKTFLFLVFALFFAATCSDFDEAAANIPKEPAPRSLFRSYDEALSLAEGSIALVDGAATRSGRTRRIAGRGQCVTAPATRSGASQTDTLMYVFNFDDGDGFSVIAANRAVDPLLAVGAGNLHLRRKDRGGELRLLYGCPRARAFATESSSGGYNAYHAHIQGGELRRTQLLRSAGSGRMGSTKCIRSLLH